MAISSDVVKLIQAEHERAHIRGDVLTIGRQHLETGESDAAAEITELREFCTKNGQVIARLMREIAAEALCL